ncbi:type I pullulanase [Bacillus methanolicus]|uniref:Pullulanase n=1 Tax=Bacillus methanolicus (strain MGA3 / ATCC 53907) TaxID=796606 RepID=I3ECD1_BACMM|nr:type I pullulanase [Bacillus methanolicus]AIE61072.1 Pullulanase [Bacillus methanolicus MGA3]EIJ84152.1 pullulanase, type I [Bacillus methanolicus MGA3]
MIAIDRQFLAYLDDLQVITILLPNSYHGGSSSYFHLTNEEINSELTIIETVKLDDSIKYICHSEIEPEFGKQYWITDEHEGKTDLQIGAVIRTQAFDERFYYDGNDLGITYSKEKTIFKLWAPTAVKVKLKLHEPGGKELEPLPMERGEFGVWFTEVHRDLECYHYSYLVCVNLEWKEAVDPYAVAVTVNGKKGVIVNLAKTRREKPSLPPFQHAVDTVIYETHIRDFTIHPNSGVKNKGLYSGAGETGTTGKDGLPTCLSYVKDLGITHIEFLPFHDFEGVDELKPANKYNWGYNPLHFNVPEGSYSTNPHDPYKRIIELKEMIYSIQKQGIRVIMDVVYNHVYIREQSSFEKIVPGYYFRHDEFGMPSNGTGVGNDIATERKMVRKFIIDSVLFWLKEYHVDGFRFDLMGIFDIETINEIRKAVSEIDESVIIIGEGWNLNTPIPPEKKANIRNQKYLPEIGQFNDWFRDSIKGSTFNLYDRGYALGNEYYYESAKQLLVGSIGFEKMDKGIFTEPIQSVNYVECHDNHTMWDKINLCEEGTDEEIKQKHHRLATVMVLLSQGIPFLHSGQEFFRTKKGVGNSYRSPDEINWLDWDRKIQFADNVEYIKGIISIRKSHKAFRFHRADLIRKHIRFLPYPKPLIGCFYEDVQEFGHWKTILVVLNPLRTVQKIDLPLGGKWEILADHKNAKAKPFRSISQKQIEVNPVSSYVLVK